LIAKDLQPLAVPIAKLKPAEKNPRRGDVEAIKKSYERFGQRKPIVVSRETSEIVAGNHQYLAAVQLGWKEIAVVWVDDDIETQVAYSIADNRIGQLGEWDVAELIEAFDFVDPAELEIAGFTEIDVEDFRALADEKLITAPATQVRGEAEGRGKDGASEGEKVSVDDFLERYAARATRGIILYYTAGDYDKMAQGLDQLAKKWNLEDNASVVQKLVEDAI
jgi:ParB-like chromosome segregation protein Spo0J